MANAKAVHMPYERDIIYTAKKDFIVDGEKNIIDPVGMFGIKLETDLYLVTAKIAVIDNLKKAIRQTGLGIDGYVISGIATSEAVISEHEKDLGVALVDIGKDITEVLIFLSGKLAHLAVLPQSGDDIVRAISEKLRIPEDAAETLKIENTTLEENKADEKITLKIENRTKTIQTAELNKIVLDGYTAIFNAVKKELASSGCGEDASSGVVICGAPAMLEGSLELAEPILNLPVRMGHIIGLGSSPKQLPGHIYATSFGLAKYASLVKRFKKSIFSMGPKNLVAAITERARSLYRDYF
jgi:cell division protein FtsA